MKTLAADISKWARPAKFVQLVQRRSVVAAVGWPEFQARTVVVSLFGTPATTPGRFIIGLRARRTTSGNKLSNVSYDVVNVVVFAISPFRVVLRFRTVRGCIRFSPKTSPPPRRFLCPSNFANDRRRLIPPRSLSRSNCLQLAPGAIFFNSATRTYVRI